MHLLIVRTTKWDVTSPLIRNHSVIHCRADNLQYNWIKEELLRKTRWVEGHRQEVTMRTAIRLVGVLLEIRRKQGPEGLAACGDAFSREELRKDAEAAVVQFGNF